MKASKLIHNAITVFFGLFFLALIITTIAILSVEMVGFWTGLFN